MRITLFFFAFINFSILCHAQTLTALNCNPQIGDVIDMYGDNYVSPGNSGIGQVWDFSALYKNFIRSYCKLPYFLSQVKV